MVNMAKKRVFLSGPITGMPNWNKEAFEEAENMIKTAGAKRVYNPTCLAPMSEKANRDHSLYMRETLHELTARKDKGGNYYDVLVQLPGWRKSRGARMEMMVATEIGMEVIEL